MNINVVFLNGAVGRRLHVLLFLVAIFVFAPVSRAAPEAVTEFISDEVSGTGAASRVAVDGLDDAWRTAVNGIGGATFETGSVFDPAAPTVLTLAGGFTVDVSLRDMDGSDPLIGAASSTQGSAGSTSSNTMQDSSPKPQSMLDLSEAYYNENSGSSSSQNGLLFTFSQPLRAFGAWFGDVETRTDGEGAPALMRLIDDMGNQIGSDITIEPTVADQQQCGASDPGDPTPGSNTFRGCGNRTTRWIGFVADAGTPVKQMLIIVGDDDSTATTSDGNTEHLSFIGATVALGPTAVSLADFSVQSTNSLIYPLLFTLLCIGGLSFYGWRRFTTQVR